MPNTSLKKLAYRALPLAIILGASILPLYWFSKYMIIRPDSAWYLLQGFNLLSGRGYTVFDQLPMPLRGPVLPFVVGTLSMLLGNDPMQVAWGMKLLSLANPLIIFLITSRLSGYWAGCLAALLWSFLGISGHLEHAFTVDSLLLTFVLLQLAIILSDVESPRAWKPIVSGLLLALAVLTKETAMVLLPVGIIYCLLMCRGFRWLVLHYAAAAIACAPWWVWVWLKVREIYLFSSTQETLLRFRLQEWIVYIPLLLVAGILVAVVLSRRGLRLKAAWYDLSGCRLAGYRQGAAGVVNGCWVLAVSWMLLRGAEGEVYNTSTWSYIWDVLRPEFHLWILVPLAYVFALRQSFAKKPSWVVYTHYLFLWTPLALLLMVIKLAPRQWLVCQALVYIAIAAMIFTLARRAITILRDNNQFVGKVAGALSLAMLVALLTLTGTSQVRALTSPPEGYNIWETNVQAEMALYRWLSNNVPEGESLVIATHDRKASHQLNLTAFLTARDYRWVPLQIRRVKIGKLLNRNYSRLTTPVWLDSQYYCSFRYLSVAAVLRQMSAADAEYIVVPLRANSYPGNNALVRSMLRTGLFDLSYYSTVTLYSPEEHKDIQLTHVVLRRNGLKLGKATEVPTILDSSTLERLGECAAESAGDNSELAIVLALPNGMTLQQFTPEGKAEYQEIWRWAYSSTTPQPGR